MTAKLNAVRTTPDTRQIIVLGMHRSGTSALTGALAHMGIYVGSDDEMMAKTWENPRGYYERKDAHTICEALLHKSGADWWKVASFHPDNARFETVSAQRIAIRDLVHRLDEQGTWALKEPRLCLLLPIFQSALNKPLAIVTVRHPVEIARSLRRRNGFTFQVGLALWEAYTVSLLRSALSMDHVFVNYNDLVSDPEATLGTLANELERRGVFGLDIEAGAASIQPALHRERYDDESDRGLLSPAQLELWNNVSGIREWERLPKLSDAAICVLREFESDEAARRQAQNSVKALTDKVATLEATNAQSTGKAREATQQVGELSKELVEIKKELAARTAAVESLRSQLEARDSQASDKQDEIGKLRTRLSDQSERLSVESQLVDQLRSELTVRDSRASEAQTALSEMRSRYAEQSERLVTADRLVGELRGELAARQSRALEEQAALSELSNRHADQSERLAATGRELESVRAKLAADQSKSLADQAALGELRGRNAEQADRLCAANRRIEELQGQLTDRDSAMSELRADQAHRVAAADQRIEELQRQLLGRDSAMSELRAELETLQGQHAEQNARLGTTQQQANELRTALADRDSKLSELAGTIEQAQRRIDKQSKRLAKRERRIESLCSDILIRDSRVSELTAALETSEQRNIELDKRLSCATSELEELEGQSSEHLETTQRQRQEWCDRLIAADQELEIERRKRKALQEKVQRQRAKSQRQHERAALLKASVHSLTGHKEQVEARLNAMETSRGWRAVSRIARLRQRLTFWKDARKGNAAPPSRSTESSRSPDSIEDSSSKSEIPIERSERLKNPSLGTSEEKSEAALKASSAALEERLLQGEPSDRLAELENERDRLQLENGKLRKNVQTRFDELAKLTRLLMEAEHYDSDTRQGLSASGTR